jgi:hypothetical protein
MNYSYVEIEFVATSFSPTRMDLVLKQLSSLPFWLDDVIMMSQALLTYAVLTSSESLAMLVGVAFIGLGKVLLGGPAQLPGIPSHKSKKLAPPSQLTILAKQRKKDSKTNHHSKPNPVILLPLILPSVPSIA